MGENRTFYVECYFNLLACLFNPALIHVLNVDVHADKSVSNNNTPPAPVCHLNPSSVKSVSLTVASCIFFVCSVAQTRAAAAAAAAELFI